MSNPKKEIFNGKTRIPRLTDEERSQGARGFVVVSNANPLPDGASAYWMIVNSDAVVATYEERKADGAGSKDMLTSRGLSGVTLKSGIPITPPKNNPCTVLTVTSGEIMCYLEDDLP